MLVKTTFTDIYFNLWTRHEVHRATSTCYLHNTDW